MDDIASLLDINNRFIDACRAGSWSQLRPLLSPSFSYMDGVTGEVWDMAHYIDALEANPAPTLVIDQVAIHVDGNTAVVSARSRSRPGFANRYVDTYERRAGGWSCVHATVWPLQDASSIGD